MASTLSTVALESLQPSAGDEVQDTRDPALSNFDQDVSRDRDPNGRKLSVLLGSAILQLPVWGKSRSMP